MLNRRQVVFLTLFLSFLTSILLFQNCGQGFKSNGDFLSFSSVTGPLADDDMVIDEDDALAVYARSASAKQSEDFLFQFVLNKPHTEDIQLSVKTETKTAMGGLDFIPLEKTVIIPAGQTSASVTVMGLAVNTIYQEKELEIVITESSAGKIAQNRAPGRILPYKNIFRGFKSLNGSTYGAPFCGVTHENKVKCLGNGSGGHLSGAIPATDHLENVKEIGGGLTHQCALLTNGQVWCWGYNDEGQVGQDPSRPYDYATTATRVPNLNNAVSISRGGNRHTCVILANKKVMCWGNNFNGQLGNGSNLNSFIPVEVTGLSDAQKIVTGGLNATCAITDLNQVKCWGHPTNNSPNETYKTPQLIAGFVNIVDLAISNSTSDSIICGLTNEKKVICQQFVVNLEAKSKRFNNSPIVMTELPNISRISSGNNAICATAEADERVYCWGSNFFHSITQKNLLDEMPFLDTALEVPEWQGAKISTGFYDICGLQKDGSAWCSGLNFGEPPHPLDHVNLGTVSALVGYQGLYCAQNTLGEIHCWGNLYKLGRSSDYTMVGKDAIMDIKKMKANQLNSVVGRTLLDGCQILPDKTVECWGDNFGGQLGNGTEVNSPTPVAVIGLTNVKQLKHGNSNRCAILSDNTLHCWGHSSSGMLTSTTSTTVERPLKIPGLSDVVDFEMGSYHICAINAAQELFCWGENEDGTVGNGATTPVYSPTKVNIEKVKKVHTSYNATCAILHDDSVKCWGANYYGELGDGSKKPVLTPRPTGFTQVKQLVINNIPGNGTDHICALTFNGTVSCIGSNASGQLGNGTTVDSYTPLTVEGLTNIKKIFAGYNYTCALGMDDTLKCWGNIYGFMQKTSIPTTVLYNVKQITDNLNVYLDSFGRVRQISGGKLSLGPQPLLED